MEEEDIEKERLEYIRRIPSGSKVWTISNGWSSGYQVRCGIKIRNRPNTMMYVKFFGSTDLLEELVNMESLTCREFENLNRMLGRKYIEEPYHHLDTTRNG